MSFPPGRSCSSCPVISIYHSISIKSILNIPCINPSLVEFQWGDNMDVKFTMVLDEKLARKLSYIGKYYGRSRIKEIEWACKQWVKEFEEKVDKIELEDT